MNVTSIGSSQTAAATQVAGAHHHHHGGGAHKTGMDAAAKALGMSSSDLRSALQSGQSLTSLAQSKGVSADTLTKAISDAVGKANPSMSSDQVQQITQRMMSGSSSATGSAATAG